MSPWSFGAWRPWYAALRVEATVMFGEADAASVVGSTRPLVRDNPIALAIVDRAQAFAERDATGVRRFAPIFAGQNKPLLRIVVLKDERPLVRWYDSWQRVATTVRQQPAASRRM